jgi:hypothetical protein
VSDPADSHLRLARLLPGEGRAQAMQEVLANTRHKAPVPGERSDGGHTVVRGNFRVGSGILYT